MTQLLEATRPYTGMDTFRTLEGMESSNVDKFGTMALPATKRRAPHRPSVAEQLEAYRRMDDGAGKGWRSSWRLYTVFAIVLASMLGIGAQVMQGGSAPDMHASGSYSLHYQQGTYLDNGWLCYGWSNGAYHCTQHWHRSGNSLISDNPSWVPNVGQAASGAKPAVPLAASTSKSAPVAPAAVGQSQAMNTDGQPCHSADMFVANISQWTVPPSCYANIYTPNPANYVYRSGFGWCNWWPEVLHPNQPDLLWSPSSHRTSTPVVGAAVFFSGGVQGASSAGHYAQVVGISPDHRWVLVTEMNFYWRGGGFGKVDYRYIQPGAGVTFIY